MLGAGGMGEVYRARDTRLSRDVALKLLPSDKSREPLLLFHLRSEAQIVARLNHTNIASLYDLEIHQDSPVLVMELVEGETLADRLARGPLPCREAVPIARQIAAALECAHEDNVIHRDLKPANIKVTARHLVKVLDFGVAKLLKDQAEQPEIGQPSLQDRTQTNVAIGTVPYMSPEQLRCQRLDTRCDIWAFGCVSFEMFTGRHPFLRTTVVDTVNAILKEEPNWHLLPSDIPPRIATLLRRCLRKDLYERLRDIGDARIEYADSEDELRHAEGELKQTFEAEISQIRRRLLAATDKREIQRLLFEADDLLSRAPSNPDLRIIRGTLAQAVAFGGVAVGTSWRPELAETAEVEVPQELAVSTRPWRGILYAAVMVLLYLLAHFLLR